MHVDPMHRAPKQVTYPTPTRWNSLQDCTLQLLAIFNNSVENGDDFAENDLHKLLVATATKTSTFSSFSKAEIDYFTEYTTLMGPISKGLDYLQGDKYSYYGQLLPTLVSIEVKLDRMNNNPALTKIKSIIPKVLERFQERFYAHLNFEESSRDAVVAAVCNPKYKLRWIASEPMQEKAKRMFLEEFNKLGQVVQEGEGDANAVADRSEDDFLIFTQAPPIDNEAKSYLESAGTSYEMLEAYPQVKKLFVRFNTPLNSSAAIERVFNFAGILSDKKRGSMTPSNFSSCMFIKGNEAFARANSTD